MTERGTDFVAEFKSTASDYAYTDSLTDTDWAWEFLRRNPDYKAAYYESRRDRYETWFIRPVFVFTANGAVVLNAGNGGCRRLPIRV